jgi:transcriptional regulator with XRE-family HTH domain
MTLPRDVGCSCDKRFTSTSIIHSERNLSEIGRKLGQRIRELRTQRPERWTQEDLAEKAKISVSFLSMIERGERVAHVETLVALAEALGVTLAELFSGLEREAGTDEDLLRPLSDFARARRLTATDVEKLLGVARAMFAAGAQSTTQ